MNGISQVNVKHRFGVRLHSASLGRELHEGTIEPASDFVP